MDEHCESELKPAVSIQESLSPNLFMKFELSFIAC